MSLISVAMFTYFISVAFYYGYAYLGMEKLQGR